MSAAAPASEVVASWLLPGTGSTVSAVTLAALVSAPACVGVTVPCTVTLRRSPGASVPSSHVMSCSVRAHAGTGFTSAIVTSAGTGSVTTTPVALDGPRLTTSMVYVTGSPAITGFGVCDFSRTSSADAKIVVSAVERLDAGAGSDVADPAIAVLLSGPVYAGSTVPSIR